MPFFGAPAVAMLALLPVGREALGGGGGNKGPQRERSVKIKLKIKRTYFENKIYTILKIKDLSARIK